MSRRNGASHGQAYWAAQGPLNAAQRRWHKFERETNTRNKPEPRSRFSRNTLENVSDDEGPLVA